MKLTTLFVLLVFSHFISAQVIPKTLEVDGPVYSTMVKGDTLFLGGAFTWLHDNDSMSQFGTLLDLSKPLVTTVTPKPNGYVYTVIPDGKNGFYVGGDFTRYGDSVRNHLAHIDSLGKVTSKLANSGFNNPVRCLQLRNDTLMVGGNFHSAGKFEDGPVAIFPFNGSARKVPKPNGTVNICISDGSGGWYICGAFTMVGDSIRNNMARTPMSTRK